jgi:hypothetical protein
MPIVTNIISSTANAKKHLLNVNLDKKSLFDDLDVYVFVVFALEPAELLVLLVEELLDVEEAVELGLITLESVEFTGLETGPSSESICTMTLELSSPSDFILFSTLEKSKPQLEQ